MMQAILSINWLFFFPFWNSDFEAETLSEEISFWGILQSYCSYFLVKMFC